MGWDDVEENVESLLKFLAHKLDYNLVPRNTPLPTTRVYADITDEVLDRELDKLLELIADEDLVGKVASIALQVATTHNPEHSYEFIQSLTDKWFTERGYKRYDKKYFKGTPDQWNTYEAYLCEWSLRFRDGELSSLIKLIDKELEVPIVTEDQLELL